MSQKVSYDDYDYIPQFDIHSKGYSLECCFHKRKKYEYQNEFRIAVLNTKDEPIKDLYIDIEPNQLQFLELKSKHNFVCEINLDVHECGKVCGVHYDISCFCFDIGLMRRRIKNVTIVGGSRIAYYLSTLLENLNFGQKP